jgi:hypothetical protein
VTDRTEQAEDPLRDLIAERLAHRQHPANAAGPSLGQFDFGRRPASCSFVCDDLLEALDSIRGEGRHTIFADTVNPEAAVFGFHIDLKVPEPFFGLAELFGDILEREDV